MRMFLPRKFVGNNDADYRKRILFNFAFSKHAHAHENFDDHEKTMRLTHAHTIEHEGGTTLLVSFTSLTHPVFDSLYEPFLNHCALSRVYFTDMIESIGVSSLMRPYNYSEYKQHTDFGCVSRMYNGWGETLGFGREYDNSYVLTPEEKNQFVLRTFHKYDELKEMVLITHATHKLDDAARRDSNFQSRIYERCPFEITLIFKYDPRCILTKVDVQTVDI